MLLARYRQVPEDNRRYVIDMEKTLAKGEVITHLDIDAPPHVDVTNVAVLPPSLRAFQIYLGGGDAGLTYPVHCVIRTSDDQAYAGVIHLIVNGVLA